MSKIKRIALFAGMFGLPAFFIGFFLLGEQQYHETPYFGKPTIVGNDTIPYSIKEYSFEDIDGKTYTQEDFKGKYVVFNFIHSGCPYEDCNINFKIFKYLIYDEFEGNAGFKDAYIVTQIFGEDSVERIKTLRSELDIDKNKWIFVKGDYQPFFDVELERGNPWQKKDTIYGYDREARVMTILKDKDDYLRGKYVTTIADEVMRITKDISMLEKEQRDRLKSSKQQ